MTVILIKNRAINPKTHYVRDFEILPVNHEAFFLFYVDKCSNVIQYANKSNLLDEFGKKKYLSKSFI